tara:strand:- start:15392 stop:15991 length:600 start_codon:yes stop_codon:yes gene_type:complete
MEEKKLEILERAAAVYLKYGIKSVTMDDLARELGMSKKTIYKFFKDKNELIFEIISMKIEMEQAVCCSTTQQSDNAIDDMMSISKIVTENIGNINPAVFYDLQKYYPEAWAIIEKHKWSFVLDMITENIARGVKEGLYRKDINGLIVGKIYVIGIDMIMNPEVFPWPEFKFEDLFKEIIRFQMSGMVNEEGRKLLKCVI